MAKPSDLVTHYSSLIFQTRIYALTFVGTVLGVSAKWIKEAENSNYVGSLLILVVVCLAEANRRYTHSYLCACLASSQKESNLNDAVSWDLFRHVNELPWAGKNPAKILARFMLYWSTFLPGISSGVYLILRDCGPTLFGWIGIATAIFSVLWWLYLSSNPLNIKQQMSTFLSIHLP